MSSKSEAIVSFIANLLPLYSGERHDERWCARSLLDGTLIVPFNANEDSNDEGWVRVFWQGDARRQTEVLGSQIATLALERYVRLHGTGAGEEAIGDELWFMAKHFHFKTGCEIHLPSLSEPPHPLAKAGRTALEIGQGVLTNLVTPRP